MPDAAGAHRVGGRWPGPAEDADVPVGHPARAHAGHAPSRRARGQLGPRRRRRHGHARRPGDAEAKDARLLGRRRRLCAVHAHHAAAAGHERGQGGVSVIGALRVPADRRVLACVHEAVQGHGAANVRGRGARRGPGQTSRAPGVVTLRYQACDDAVCYRPTTGSFVSFEDREVVRRARRYQAAASPQFPTQLVRRPEGRRLHTPGKP